MRQKYNKIVGFYLSEQNQFLEKHEQRYDIFRLIGNKIYILNIPGGPENMWLLSLKDWRKIPHNFFLR